MATTIINNPSEVGYTWNDLNFAWNSSNAQAMAWNTASYTLNELSVLEDVNIAETYWDNILFNLRILENILLSDSARRTTTKNITELLTVIEARTQTFIKLSTESVNLADVNYQRVVQLHREAFAITDGLNRNTYKLLREAFAIAETNKLSLTKLVKETISCLESVSRQVSFIRKTFENVGIADSKVFAITSNKKEAFTVNDYLAHNVGKNLSEIINVAEVLGRSANYRRTMSEVIALAEGMAKTCNITHKEAFAVIDDYIENVKAVLSNIGIYEGEMTLADFQNAIATPPGYNTFRDFVVGDYEYQKALMRIVINAPATDSQPVIKDVIPYVDIEDTDDRGEVTITQTATATKVYFNKFYYNAPEVNVTLKGGSGVITPNIVSTTGLDEGGRYFEVELLNGSGNRVTGTFSWTSKGY